MAAYTSSQDGAWNTGATWVGGVAPNANDDTAAIGHKITYDRGVSATTWGNVTVGNGGMLVFPIDSSWKILFNSTGILTINSGGEIRTGTTTATGDLGAAYLGQIHFPQGATARYTFVLTDGGIINLFGANIYGVSDRYVDLKANWTTGSTLYATGDITSKTCWSAGKVFYIYDNADSYATIGYTVQGDTYTISSIGSYDSANDRTPIIVTASNPDRSCYAVSSAGWQSKLIMCSRNLELADPGTQFGVYYYNTYVERIRFDNNQAAGNDKIRFKNCMFYGWDFCADGGYNFNAENINYLNNATVFSGGFNQVCSGDFISNYYISNQSTQCNITSGTIASTNYGISGGSTAGALNSKLYCDFISNNMGCNVCVSNDIIGDFIGNATAINSCYLSTIQGSFSANNINFSTGSGNLVKGDIAGTISMPSQTSNTSLILEESTLSSENKRAIRIYTNSGNILPLLSGESGWQTPTSNNTWILQVTPNSYCNTSNLGKLSLTQSKKMAYYAAATSQTLTFKIYPLAYTTALTQTDVQLEVSYLNTTSGVTRTTVYNTSQTYNTDGWRDCSVTLTPAQAGVVYFNLTFMKYESGATVLIDPVWSIA